MIEKLLVKAKEVLDSYEEGITSCVITTFKDKTVSVSVTYTDGSSETRTKKLL